MRVRHDRGVMPAIGSSPGCYRHLIGEVHPKSGVGQYRGAFALATRVRVGPEFEMKAHICRFRSWCGPRPAPVLLAVTLPGSPLRFDRSSDSAAATMRR